MSLDGTNFNRSAWEMTEFPRQTLGRLALQPGSRIGVVGAGPAGSFFSTFLLRMAQTVDLDIKVDLFEPRDFRARGAAGCNMCGGIISESLVQALATEGISLPPTVVKRGIESYVLHVPEGSVRIETPLEEKRIAAVHRGAGPRGSTDEGWQSFDGFLLEQAVSAGAKWKRTRIERVTRSGGLPVLHPKSGDARAYDMVVIATGVNAGGQKLLEGIPLAYKPPEVTRTYITELHLGRELVDKHLGTAMHVFLLDLPRLEFAALIPKEDYVTVVMLGQSIDSTLISAFLESPEVSRCLPPEWSAPKQRCHCSPRITVRAATTPFADRLVFIGDCGVSRLYKDGIGAAYRCAKAAAVTALFHGVAEADFRKVYLPVCEQLERDNFIGRAMFGLARHQQRSPRGRRAMLRTVEQEQTSRGGSRRLSMILWDIFTGSAPYQDILIRSMHPTLFFRFVWEAAMGMLFGRQSGALTTKGMGRERVNTLGADHPDGTVILREGEVATCMYVIEAGQVEIIRSQNGVEVRLGLLGQGDVFGEMALFEGEERCATARVVGNARVLTVDKATFLRKVQSDPSMAFRLLRKLSRRIRDLNEEVIRLKARETVGAALAVRTHDGTLDVADHS